MVWYSHLFKNFPQFIVIHTVKGFGIVNKAEIDVFLELSCFFNDPANVGNLISCSSAFSKTSLNIWKFTNGLKPLNCTPQMGELYMYILYIYSHYYIYIHTIIYILYTTQYYIHNILYIIVCVYIIVVCM